MKLSNKDMTVVFKDVFKGPQGQRVVVFLIKLVTVSRIGGS